MRLQQMTPDRRTREVARRIREGDLRFMRFYGVGFGRFANDPLEVKDAKLMRTILQALREAMARPELQFANRADTLEVHLRSRREPIVLSFNAKITVDAFGPKFQQALRQVAAWHAAEVRKTIRQLATRVKAVRIEEAHITDSSELREVLKALQQLDARAFDFTNPNSAPSWVSIFLRDGGELTVYLVFEKVSGDRFPLPSPLRRYFTDGS